MQYKRGILDYSGFNPEAPISPELLEPYTDALADESIEHFFASSEEAIFSQAVSLHVSTEYAVDNRLYNFGTSRPDDLTLGEFDIEASFISGVLGDLSIRTIRDDDSPEIFHIKGDKERVGVFMGFAEDSDDIHFLSDDDLTELSLRAANFDPLEISGTIHIKEQTESDQAKPSGLSFTDYLARYWEGLARRIGGTIIATHYVEVPIPTTQQNPTSARLLLEDTEKLGETRQRLVIEHVTTYQELDAEQIFRLELEYVLKEQESVQYTNAHKLVVSDLRPELAYARIKKIQQNGRSEAVTPTNDIMQQFSVLLRYVVES